MGVFESFDEAIPPFVVLGEDYEGCEESVTGGYMQWNLLEIDENLGSVLAIGVIDGRETVVGPAGVECSESEGERRKSGGPNGEGDWCMMVRKWAKYGAEGNVPEMRLSRRLSAPNGSWLTRASQGSSQAENCCEKTDQSNDSCPPPHQCVHAS